MQSSALIKDRVPDVDDHGYSAVWEQAACMNIQLDNVSEALLRSENGWLSGAPLVERLRQIRQLRQPLKHELTAADEPSIHAFAAGVQSYVWARAAIQLTLSDPLFQFVGALDTSIYYVTRRPLMLLHQPYSNWHLQIPEQVLVLKQGSHPHLLSTSERASKHPHVIQSDGNFCFGDNALDMDLALRGMHKHVHALRSAVQTMSRICEVITYKYEHQYRPSTYQSFLQLPQAVRQRIAEITAENNAHWERPILELPKEST